MPSTPLSFIKKSYGSIALAQDASTTTVGSIVFDEAHKVICVNGNVYGGNITDATYTNNILTINKADGTSITLNFADIASASSVMQVFDQIKGIIGLSTGSETTLQGFYGTTTYLQGAQTVVQTAVALDSAIHTVQGDAQTMQGYIQASQGYIQTAQGAVEIAQGAVQVTQGALEITQGYVENLSTNLGVTVEELLTPTAGYLKTYVVKQGGTQVGSAIDIPKDFLVKSASIINVVEYPVGSGTYYDETDTTHSNPLPVTSAGKYIDFVINVAQGTATDQHIYLNVQDLVDVYTVQGSATQIQLNIDSSNVISAIIVQGAVGTWELAAQGVRYDKIAMQGVQGWNIAQGAIEDWHLSSGFITVAQSPDVTVNDANPTTLATVGGQNIQAQVHLYWTEW